MDEDAKVLVRAFEEWLEQPDDTLFGNAQDTWTVENFVGQYGTPEVWAVIEWAVVMKGMSDLTQLPAMIRAYLIEKRNTDEHYQVTAECFQDLVGCWLGVRLLNDQNWFGLLEKVAGGMIRLKLHTKKKAFERFIIPVKNILSAGQYKDEAGIGKGGSE